MKSSRTALKTVAEAVLPSAKITMFLAYLKAEDSAGAGMARKFLRTGWTRDRVLSVLKGRWLADGAYLA